MSELMSCPFCGGEGHGIQVRENKFWTGMRYAVTSVTIIHWCKQDDGPSSSIQIKARTREEAVSRWNTRHYG